MYIYAIDRIGDAAYKCNEDATRDATPTPLLPYISLSTPSKVCPLSVFTRTLTPTRFAYGRQKSICCNMKQHVAAKWPFASPPYTCTAAISSGIPTKIGA